MYIRGSVEAHPLLRRALIGPLFLYPTNLSIPNKPINQAIFPLTSPNKP